jgi:Ca-activated chloride channel family protein
MRLFSPEWLLLLPLAIALAVLGWRRPQGRFRFPNIRTLREVSGSFVNPRRILVGVRVVALVLLIIALSRPQSGRKFTEISSEGVDIMLALDTSGSMAALDLKLEGHPAPRVDVVKSVAGEFMKRRLSDRLGLVVFGETAFVQCPLTLDHEMAGTLLDGVHIGMAGDSTAVGDAIAVGVSHMKNLKAKSRVLILLTDGSSNSGVVEPLKAAELARTYHVKVYTIGVGIDGDAPFLVDGAFGKQVVYQRADLDEDTLKRVADITGAKFYRAQDTETLKQIYDEIDKLEKTEVKVKQYAEYNELFAWFLIPGLLLLLSEVGLGQTVLRKIP